MVHAWNAITLDLFAAQIGGEGQLRESFLNHFPAKCAAGEDASQKASRNEGLTMKGILIAVTTVVFGTLAYITIGIALASVS